MTHSVEPNKDAAFLPLFGNRVVCTFMLPARTAIVALLRGANRLWLYHTDLAVFLLPLDSHNDSLQHCLQPVPTCTLYLSQINLEHNLRFVNT